ncbi:uncharacterized protein LOC110626840 isoform X2 [Manihot esculenta]|uniref:uncharacterized protein LOC110626840 isoform X2 n=1 Tax=Manihot esculenta TaxID=3983 RepID=UPI001CC3548F|nr:uncharacterized protein LOC110626840 isoform X2 [Manihot esculenta]
MEKCNSNLSLFLHILLLTLFTCNPTAISQSSTSEGGLCSSVFCGQGTCNNIDTLPGFECNCYDGWNKIQIGPLTFPSCLIPNCTVDLQCGNGSPPPPPPPSLPLFPHLPNLTDPCFLIWCADGSCLSSGTGHTCQCNEGSANLLNNSELPCFQECSSEASNSLRSLGVLTMIFLAAAASPTLF